MNDFIPFDFETAPDLKMVRELYEFEPKLGPFDPDSVLVGNLKDPAKIRAKMEAKEAEHNLARTNEESDFWAGLDDKAALKGLTARVVGLGYRLPGDDISITVEDDKEAAILAEFWGLYNNIKKGHDRRRDLVGWNIGSFDLVMVIQRSRILGIEVPGVVLQKGRYWDTVFIDLMTVWGCGQYGKWDGLTRVAKAMGVGQPREHGVKGKDFHKVIKSDPAKAKAYLTDDILETEGIAERIL